MVYNNVNIDDEPAVTEYKDPPTWTETLEASATNFTSVALSTSEFNYYNDERVSKMEEWKKNDPQNQFIYEQVGTLPKQVTEKLETLYDSGNIDAIKNWNSMGTGDTFLQFKELQREKGLAGPKDIIEIAKNKSLQDYYESKEVVDDSDHWSAQMLGTMWGALHDPVTLATLPLGTFKTGGSIAWNAARAFGEEAAIETAAQSVIMPTTLAYKNEIGIRTTVREEAYNALMSIGSAGLLRMTGSTTWDITEKGIKALKAKDPDLAEAYESTSKSNVSEDAESHINTLYKAEFGEEEVSKVINPNEQGRALNEAPNIPFEDELIITQAKQSLKELDGITVAKEKIGTLDVEKIQMYIGDRIGADHKALDIELQKVAGDYEGPAIRGMLDTEGVLAKLNVGDVYETRGVTSIAKDKETADLFVKEEFHGKTGGKVYVTFDSFENKPVNIGQGNKVGFDSMLEDPKPNAKGTYIEDEVLVPSGRNFKVTSKTIKDGETFLTVKEQSPKQKTKAPKEKQEEPMLYSGDDEAGQPIYRTYKELQDEIDLEAEYIRKVEDCIL